MLGVTDDLLDGAAGGGRSVPGSFLPAWPPYRSSDGAKVPSLLNGAKLVLNGLNQAALGWIA